MFNENLGIERKAARLRNLRDRWAQNPKCRILHSTDPAQGCGIGFVAFQGVDPQKIRNALWSKYSILTAYMPHEEHTGLRVTPNVYKTVSDVDYFASMVEHKLKNS